MKGKITIIILVCVTLIVVAYMYNQRQKTRAQADLANAQVNLINAQTSQQAACDSSWQCSATGLLTGVGDMLGGLGQLF